MILQYKSWKDDEGDSRTGRVAQRAGIWCKPDQAPCLNITPEFQPETALFWSRR